MTRGDDRPAPSDHNFWVDWEDYEAGRRIVRPFGQRVTMVHPEFEEDPMVGLLWAAQRRGLR